MRARKDNKKECRVQSQSPRFFKLSNSRPETRTFRHDQVQNTHRQVPRHCTPTFQASVPGSG
jgi:hypothetical protein